MAEGNPQEPPRQKAQMPNGYGQIAQEWHRCPPPKQTPKDPRELNPWQCIPVPVRIQKAPPEEAPN